MSEITRTNNVRGAGKKVCPGGVPAPVPLYAQRAACEGYLYSGIEFWVAQPRHLGFFALHIHADADVMTCGVTSSTSHDVMA